MSQLYLLPVLSECNLRRKKYHSAVFDSKRGKIIHVGDGEII